jgi:hypothetical protein
MKVQVQSGGLLTSQSGYYDFYKKVDTNDFRILNHLYLKSEDHT